MRPYSEVICGNVLTVLRAMKSDSIDCICTSPPYWGMRMYDAPDVIWDGDPNCVHEWESNVSKKKEHRGKIATTLKDESIINKDSNFCKKCRAWKGQLGAEPTLDLYLQHMLLITAELKRVLKESGVLYWNHGNSYASSGSEMTRFWHGDNPGKHRFSGDGNLSKGYSGRCRTKEIPPKSLVMQNYRLAIRMIDEQGFILRNTIIWSKRNHMPASVQDRYTNAYEPVYMFVKNQKYYFDLDAVRIPTTCVGVTDKRPHGILRQRLYKGSAYRKSNDPHLSQFTSGIKCLDIGGQRAQGLSRNRRDGKPEMLDNPAGKNPGDVWDIKSPIENWQQLFEVASEIVGPENALSIFELYLKSMGISSDVWNLTTTPFPGAHFAVFPETLMEKPIKSSCPKQICPKCGKARVRIVKKEGEPKYNEQGSPEGKERSKMKWKDSHPNHNPRWWNTNQTIGWTDCGCGAGFVPGVTLDPFCGSGTTGVVAAKEKVNFIGIDVSPKYCKMAKKRIKSHFRNTHSII